MSDIPEISFKKREDSKLEFEIFPLEHLFRRSPTLTLSIHQPHRVSFHQILFITQGTGKHFIDFKPYEFKEGNLVFISKGQVHAFETQQKYEGFLMLFTEGFITQNFIKSDVLSLNRLYNYYLGDPIIEPNQIGVQVFRSLVAEISKEFNYADNFAKEEILSLLLRVVLLKAERIKKTLFPLEKNANGFARFGAFQHLLEVHISESRNAQFYAEKLGISYKHLNEVCKRVTGSTAKEFIDQHLILEIKRILVVSNLSIKELAYEMSFEEPTNFAKFFKKHVGISPAQFRKSQILTERVSNKSV